MGVAKRRRCGAKESRAGISSLGSVPMIPQLPNEYLFELVTGDSLAGAARNQGSKHVLVIVLLHNFQTQLKIEFGPLTHGPLPQRLQFQQLGKLACCLLATR